MSETQHAARAAETFADVVADVKPDQLSAQTPCAEYDVRKLVNHLLFWGPVLEAAARKETVAPRAEAEADVDLTQGDWAGALQAQARRVAAAWSRPEAWRGATRMGGPDEMPAPLIGGMVVVELVVHGWDLARATGQAPTWDADVVAFAHREVVKTAEFGRSMGVYGPEVPVAAEAPAFELMLGLTGRDPAWTP